MKSKTCAIYFSPTKTTKQIVQTIASGLDEDYKEYNLTMPQKRELYKELTFGSDDIIVVGVPVYKGRIPSCMAHFFSNFKGDNTKAIFTVTYGNRDYDDALLELKELFEQRGFVGIAAGAFIGEHSYSTDVATNRPDANDLSIASQFATKIKTQLNDAIDFSKQTLTVKGNHPYKESLAGPLMLPETNDQCTECAICANTCPMGAIDFINFRDIDPNKCIQCSNCVKVCPENAKAFNAPFFLEFREVLIHKLAVGRKEPEMYYSFEH